MDVKVKRVDASKKVGIRYNTELQRIIKQVYNDLYPPLFEYDNDDSLVLTPKQVSLVFDETLRRYDSPYFKAVARQIAERFVTDANKTNKELNKKYFGIDLLSQSPALTRFVASSVEANSRLITRMSSDFIKRAETAVLANYQAGLRSTEMIKTLQSELEIGEKRARFIARDQTAKVNGGLNKQRQQDAGIKYFKWLTSQDIAVRDRHKKIANHVTKFGKGIYSWDDLPVSDSGQLIYPGWDYNCFTGQSNINNTTFCNILYRRRYSGKLTQLIFNDGVILSSTGNHPILTTRGFKPASLINESDDIIRASNQSFLNVEFNSKGVIPTFEQVFSSLELSGVKCSVSPHIRGKFHGDTSDSDIDIIRIDSLLVNVINPLVIKKLAKFDFTNSDKKIIFDSLSCFGKINGGFNASLHSLCRIMSSKDLTIPLFLSHFTPLECFGLALGSWFDPSLIYKSSNHISGNSKMFRDCVFAFSVLVHGHSLYSKAIHFILRNRVRGINSILLDSSKYNAFTNSSHTANIGDRNSVRYKTDNIIDNKLVGFSSHVYNLETFSGDYTVNNTVVSNCRCTGIPVFDWQLENNK